MNAFAKAAAEYHDPLEIVFYRGVVALALLLAYIAFKKRADFYKTARIKSHIGRALVGNFGVFTVFWSYKLLPMADVTALLFSAPLIVTMLSALILKEHVGIYRWAAVVTGFVGVLLIIGPDAGTFGDYKSFVPLLAAFSTALVAIFLRDLGKTEDSITTVFYFLLFGVLFSGIYMLFSGTLPVPDAADLLVATGIAAFVQLMMKTESFRLAEASLLSPFSYIMLLWAIIIGWVFWGDVPGMEVLCGAAVIIASNLFITWRESKRRRKTDTPPIL